jgi:NAD(P)-dependent dehydrogenase (short-subunit alcohol dehydrogenase family)
LLFLYAIVGTLATIVGALAPPGSRRRGLLRAPFVGGALLPWVYFLFVRPWHLNWSVTEEEERRPLPYDHFVPRPVAQITHAVTIHAPADEVWRWLVQMGQGRGGMYSYDWLENLADLDIHSAEEILPEFQDLKVGDLVRLAPERMGAEAGLRVAALEPGRALVLHQPAEPDTGRPRDRDDPNLGSYYGWNWVFVLDEIDQGSTRLIVRSRVDGGPRYLIKAFYTLLLEFPHFVMERGMLKGIKHRAERNMNASHAIMDGKVVLITGGTGGIGKDIADGLASMHASVVVVGHNRSKGEAAVAEIKASSGNEAVELMVADLSSQAEIHRLAREFEAHHDRLDVLVNNAGAMYARRWETADGIEGTLAVTHLAPVLLTNLLLPVLQKSTPSRIVNVSSWSHRLARLNLDDLQMREHYSPRAAYSRAKLINLLWTYELARRLEGTGVTVNLADPGGASTEMTRSEAMPWIFRTINRLGQKVMTTEKAARVSIYLASSPDVEGANGGYFDHNNKQIKSSKASYDEEAQKRIWEVSAELTKQDRSLPLQRANRTQ